MLSKEQIVELATVIKNDIAPYIAAHRAEYEAYLREEKEVAYRSEKSEAPGHFGDNQ